MQNLQRINFAYATQSLLFLTTRLGKLNSHLYRHPFVLCHTTHFISLWFLCNKLLKNVNFAINRYAASHSLLWQNQETSKTNILQSGRITRWHTATCNLCTHPRGQLFKVYISKSPVTLLQNERNLKNNRHKYNLKLCHRTISTLKSTIIIGIHQIINWSA